MRGPTLARGDDLHLEGTVETVVVVVGGNVVVVVVACVEDVAVGVVGVAAAVGLSCESCPAPLDVCKGALGA